MNILQENTYGNVKVIQNNSYQWAVTDLLGKVIVPFGKYDWIDGFDQGLARVKIGKEPSTKANNSNLWGIINERGEEVLPVEYNEVWKFLGKNRHTTTVKKNGITKLIYFRDLNSPVKPQEQNQDVVEETVDENTDNIFDEDLYGLLF